MEENKMELASNFIHDFIDEDLAAGVTATCKHAFPRSRTATCTSAMQGNLHQFCHRIEVRWQVQPAPGRHKPYKRGYGVCRCDPRRY